MRLALLPSLPLDMTTGAAETTTGMPAVTAPSGQTGGAPTTPPQPVQTQAQGIVSSVRQSGVGGP